jgi:ketosteroid isomerase-like protein
MDEREVRELFFERLEHLSADAEYELRHPDYVMEMPQSGERIRGRDNMRAFQEAYPNPPTITPGRVVGSGDMWVIEGRSDYGGDQICHVSMIVEFRDGKIWRDTRYYAEPFQAPDWGRNGLRGWRNLQHSVDRQRRRLPRAAAEDLPTRQLGPRIG